MEIEGKNVSGMTAIFSVCFEIEPGVRSKLPSGHLAPVKSVVKSSMMGGGGEGVEVFVAVFFVHIVKAFLVGFFMKMGGCTIEGASLRRTGVA